MLRNIAIQLKTRPKYSLSNRKQALQCYASAVPCRMLEDKVENSFITWSVPKTAIVSRDNRFLEYLFLKIPGYVILYDENSCHMREILLFQLS